MAVLIINGNTHELPDDSSIALVCEQAGVVFDCNTGVCGSCLIQIEEGAENLNALTDEETELGLDESKRLACMCVIRCGTVKVKF